MKGEIKLNEKSKNTLGLFWGIIASLITLMSLAIAMFVIVDKKKKREEKELEDYLETSIN